MKLVNESLIKDWEELRLEAYLPTPNDVWTIGWGHTKGVYPGMRITEAQAQKYFEEDVAWVAATINDLVKVKLNQNQYDALSSIIFNIGRTNFSRSTLLRKLNAGDYEGAANEFLRWDKQKGKVLRGLVRRRAKERDYFLLKPLTKSKEVVGGSVAVVTGLGSILGMSRPELHDPLSWVVCVALVAVGAFFVWNRMKARKGGHR